MTTPRPESVGLLPGDDELLASFAAEAARQGTEVFWAADPDAACQLVAGVLAGRPSLVDDIPLLHALVPPPAPDDPWDAEVGVSEAIAGAASTGTVALVQRSGSPRRTSLLVHRHVVLLDRSRLLPDYQSLVDAVAALSPRPTGVQFVSGHSRSGDIESAMVHGMHGPADLMVVVYAS